MESTSKKTSNSNATTYQKEYAPEDLLNLCLKEHREELIRTMEATEIF